MTMAEILDPGKFYDERVNNYGLSAATVGWKSYEQQKLRFDILTSALDLKNKSILDIGCGLGDLANYLEASKVYFKEYIGIDVSDNMLMMAKQNVLPQLPTVFFNLNILKDSISTECDFAIMSGLLNLKQSNSSSLGLLDVFLSKTRVVVKQGLAFNLLTDQVDYIQPHHAHFNPKEVRSVTEKYFKQVSIHENYGLYEFTVIGLV
jgi:SAM-dependent methyltransferase